MDNGTMSEEDIMKELSADINSLLDFNFKREVILLVALHAEYLSKELILLNLGYTKNKKFNSHDNRIIKLKKESIIEDNEFRVLSSLSRVRDELAHNLYVNEEYLKREMDKIPLNWMLPNGQSIQHLDEEYSKYPFTRFCIGCLAKIFFLFQKIAYLKSQSKFSFTFQFKQRAEDTFLIDLRHQ